MDRRAVFFVIAAVVTFALIPAVPDDPAHPLVKWVGPVLAGAFVVLALLSFLDFLSRRSDHP